MNGSVYAIPGDHPANVANHAGSGSADVVTLRAPWPGLEPPRPDNAHLRERGQAPRHLQIAPLSRPRGGHEFLQGFARLRGARPEPAEFGLTRCASRLQEPYAGEGSSDRTPADSPVVLACRDYSDRQKASFEVELACLVEYPPGDGVGLYYRFFMVNLAWWPEIDRAGRALVNSHLRPSEVT